MKIAKIELMLFTDTHFSSLQLCEKFGTINDNDEKNKVSLEEACWDGLCLDLLEELFQISENRNKLILWKITQADHFLELEYGENPRANEEAFSLNPYYF